jgi:hypothetical protein
VLSKVAKILLVVVLEPLSRPSSCAELGPLRLSVRSLKFPQPSVLGLLFRVHGRDRGGEKGARALDMVLSTLDGMAQVGEGGGATTAQPSQSAASVKFGCVKSSSSSVVTNIVIIDRHDLSVS